MTGYVFYDTETTGTLTTYDQILQFGAIRTDGALKELERFDIRCRLMPHVVPAPKALEITGVTPEMLVDPSLPSHYEAMLKIHKTLTSWSPSVFVGFNSISFDEPLLRQAFYQTLQPIYLTNTGGNSRADVLRIVHAASVYAFNAISIPIGDNERPVYRLDGLAPANGFASADAHEAMVDVEATIHMAKLVKDRAPTVWDSMMARTRKQDVSDFLSDGEVVCLTQFYAARPHSRLVTACGMNLKHDAERAVFDLSYQPEDFLPLSVDALIDVLKAQATPIRVVRANAQPILMPFESAPTHLVNAEISRAEYERRAAVVQHDKEFQKHVGQALATRYPEKTTSRHINEKIYDGFASGTDQMIMKQFHKAKWKGRTALADQLHDQRMKQLAYRLIYLERPELLPESMRLSFDGLVADRLLTDDPSVPWRTIPKALQETEYLLSSSHEEKQKHFYRAVRQFLSDRDKFTEHRLDAKPPVSDREDRIEAF